MASNFYLAPGEDFVQCPYSLAHRITNMKFLTHLAKCRDQYLKDCQNEGKRPDMDSCRYNKLHQFPKLEKTVHEERCPNRYSIIPHIQYHQSEEFEKVKKERQENTVMEDQPNGRESRSDRKDKVRVKKERHDYEDDGEVQIIKKEPRESSSSRRRDSKDSDRDRDKYKRGDRDSDRRSRDRDRNKDDRRNDKDKDRRKSSSPFEPKVFDRKFQPNQKHKPNFKGNKRPPSPPLLTTADLGDENWDEDCKEGYEPGYDPKVKLEQDCILYTPCGLKRAERKQFRLENRRKALQKAVEEDVADRFIPPPAIDRASDLPTTSYRHIPVAATNGGSSFIPHDIKPTIVNIPQPVTTTRRPSQSSSRSHNSQNSSAVTVPPPKPFPVVTAPPPKPPPVVTAPPLKPPPIKRDPDEPYEEGEIEDDEDEEMEVESTITTTPAETVSENQPNSQVEEADYDWNSDDD